MSNIEMNDWSLGSLCNLADRISKRLLCCLLIATADVKIWFLSGNYSPYTSRCESKIGDASVCQTCKHAYQHTNTAHSIQHTVSRKVMDDGPYRARSKITDVCVCVCVCCVCVCVCVCVGTAVLQHTYGSSSELNKDPSPYSSGRWYWHGKAEA